MRKEWLAVDGVPAWQGVIALPVQGRATKPRTRGVTMVIDKGMGLMQMKDWLSLASDTVDYLKLGFGTSAFYPRRLLEAKVDAARAFGVELYPGGTFAEVALWQGCFDRYLANLKALGMHTVEISDGTISLPVQQRQEAIQRALDKGVDVITEVGKKQIDEQPPLEWLWEQAQRDLEHGVRYVIMEARESGKGIGIYDEQGAISVEGLTFLQHAQSEDRMMWEAPLKSQQEQLILRLGPNVSLGNIAPQDALALEALRVGLRADTLRTSIAEQVSDASWYVQTG